MTQKLDLIHEQTLGANAPWFDTVYFKYPYEAVHIEFRIKTDLVGATPVLNLLSVWFNNIRTDTSYWHWCSWVTGVVSASTKSANNLVGRCHGVNSTLDQWSYGKGLLLFPNVEQLHTGKPILSLKTWGTWTTSYNFETMGHLMLIEQAFQPITSIQVSVNDFENYNILAGSYLLVYGWRHED